MSRSDAALLRTANAEAFGVLYGRHAAAVHDWFARRVAWADAPVVRDAAAFGALQARLFAHG